MLPLRPLAVVLSLAIASAAFAQPLPQTQPSPPAAPPPYGLSLTLDQARRAVAAAEAEATRNGWSMAIAVVDAGGRLVLFQRMDGTQLGSLDPAVGKAVTAVNYRRPTKALEDGVAGGGAGLQLLAVPGLLPVNGGFPIVLDGRVVGGIGASGARTAQDAQVAKAGLDAVAP